MVDRRPAAILWKNAALAFLLCAVPAWSARGQDTSGSAPLQLTTPQSKQTPQSLSFHNDDWSTTQIYFRNPPKDLNRINLTISIRNTIPK